MYQFGPEVIPGLGLYLVSSKSSVTPSKQDKHTQNEKKTPKPTQTLQQVTVVLHV